MLLSGDKIYSVERSKQIQEIDALRGRAARTQELEAENRKLSAELEEARQWHPERANITGHGDHSDADRSNATMEAKTKAESLTVGIEEYSRVRDELLKLESDYGKLVWARDHLETKVREQKDSLRQWKEYRKNWILKHSNKRLGHLPPSSARASQLKTAKNRRSSSAPAPPALPKGLSPSVGGASRSPSPHHNAPADLSDIEDPHGQVLDHHSRDQGSLSNETGLLQAGHNIANASDPGDVTEATPESEGQAEPTKTKPATDGSSPIIVFERSLKRRRSARGGVQNVRLHEDDQCHLGAVSGTLPSKDEQISSPTSFPCLLHLNGPHDSLDLDDVGGHLDTPRKRQRMAAQERLRSSMIMPLTAMQDDEGMLNGMTMGEKFRHFDDEHPKIEGERDKQATSPPENHRTLLGEAAEEEKKARREERIARQHAHNDRVHQRLEAAERRDPVFDCPRSSSPIASEPAQKSNTPDGPREGRLRKPQLASPVILQPRDVNAAVLPRTSNRSANRKRPCPPSRRDRGAAYVQALAEDGEGPSSNGDAIKAGKISKDEQNNRPDSAEKEPKAPSAHHRLGALLTKPSPEKSLLLSEAPVDDVSLGQTWSKTPIPRSVYHNRSKGPLTPRSLPAKKSELNYGRRSKVGPVDFEPVDATIDRYSKSAQADNKRTRHGPASDKPQTVDHSETRPEHEPLRARPVHRLGLLDFKFNPAHSDYAYHETVRAHDEKKSLSGCTDRHCPRCKGLRTYVTDSGYKTAQKPGETEADADRRLLHAFLGERHHRQLRSLSKPTRADLLLEAKVQEFADRFGCHRQAFGGAREAPGHWEVDFPTTQEQAANRAAADVMEREKVEERYWEAMRAGGKWMFADE